MPFTRDDAIAIGKQLFNPRGRCDRRGFLFLAIALLLLQAIISIIVKMAGHPLHGRMFTVMNIPLFWIGYMATVKRLHDSGKSGWWVPPAFALWIGGALIISTIATLIVGPAMMNQAVAEKTWLLWLLTAAISLPAFGALLWLHAAQGDTGPNRFGPVPGPHGFAPGVRKGRTAGGNDQNRLPVGVATPA